MNKPALNVRAMSMPVWAARWPDATPFATVAEEFFGGRTRTFLPAALPVLIIPACKPDWPSPLLLLPM